MASPNFKKIASTSESEDEKVQEGPLFSQTQQRKTTIPTSSSSSSSSPSSPSSPEQVVSTDEKKPKLDSNREYESKASLASSKREREESWPAQNTPKKMNLDSNSEQQRSQRVAFDLGYRSTEVQPTDDFWDAQSTPNTPKKLNSNGEQNRSRRLAFDLLRKYRSAQVKFRALAEDAGTLASCDAAWPPLRNFEARLEKLAGVKSKMATYDEYGSSSDSTDDERGGTDCPTCGRKERGVIIPCLHRGCMFCVRPEESLKCRICDGVALKIQLLPEEI